MLHKKFNQDLATYNFLRKKLIHVKLKVCLRFKLFKSFSGNAQNQSTEAPTAIKKALLTTAAYFKVSAPVRSQRLNKGVYGIKQKK